MWLGTRSYSLYLVHAVVIEIVWRVAIRPFGLAEPLPLVLEVVLGLAAAVGVAAAFHALVERRFTVRKRPQAAQPDAAPARRRAGHRVVQPAVTTTDAPEGR
ncbi:hypothetical protein GCM10025868_20230 [Angustibacter aerolatus]|uniref:Acyltransferase 3 domain-containing protein n=1 Tax=Angustibacter aerolatus TaxID=1162965 RepID=A0ABQ6JF21_9ACTN|nr:hypothetical protein GCM10025868_20230 [Angustibacter aerolatus]